MSARCTSCLERENRGLWGALRLVPFHSLAPGITQSFCSWRGPGWGWRRYPKAGRRATGSLPSSPATLWSSWCLPGTTVFPGQLGSAELQAEAPVGLFFVSPTTASPVSRLHLVQLLAIHPRPAAVSVTFSLGTLVGVCGFCMPVAIFTRLLSLHPSGILGLPGEWGHPWLLPCSVSSRPVVGNALCVDISV